MPESKKLSRRQEEIVRMQNMQSAVEKSGTKKLSQDSLEKRHSKESMEVVLIRKQRFLLLLKSLLENKTGLSDERKIKIQEKISLLEEDIRILELGGEVELENPDVLKHRAGIRIAGQEVSISKTETEMAIENWEIIFKLYENKILDPYDVTSSELITKIEKQRQSTERQNTEIREGLINELRIFFPYPNRLLSEGETFNLSVAELEKLNELVAEEKEIIIQKLALQNQEVLDFLNEQNFFVRYSFDSNSYIFRHTGSLKINFVDPDELETRPYRTFIQDQFTYTEQLTKLQLLLSKNNWPNPANALMHWGNGIDNFIDDNLVFPEQMLKHKIEILYHSWIKNGVLQASVTAKLDPSVNTRAFSNLYALLVERENYDKLNSNPQGAYILGSVLDSLFGNYATPKQNLEANSSNLQTPDQLINLAAKEIIKLAL